MIARFASLTILVAVPMCSQTLEKVFSFAHLQTPQALQEVTNVVRSIGDIRDVSVDIQKRSITVNGTENQLALAGWLAAGLDDPGAAPSTRDFPFDTSRAPLAQIAYLKYVDHPYTLQEFVNAIRSTVDIQRFFPMNQPPAIVMRGTPEQVKAADWLLSVLDQPPGPPADGAIGRDYRLTGEGWEPRSGLNLRVAYLTNLTTPEALQQVTNVTRSIVDLQRCFPISSRNVLLMRGSDEQIAMANWLLKELDTPGGRGIREFQAPSATGQITQVAYVNAASPEALQETVNEIRSTTKMLRVFPLHARNAIAMRGTPDQVAQASALLK